MNLFLPQFEIDKRINLYTILQNLGIKKAFNIITEFQGISSEYHMHIEEVILKNYINVNIRVIKQHLFPIFI